MGQVKRKFNEYKSMPGGNSHDRPILMKDGKVIDQDASVIEDKVIADGMRYVVKMTRGLATGVMSLDEEYIELQNKVLEGIITERSSAIRAKIEKESKQKINQYIEAHKCHDKALQHMYAQSAQIAKDNSVSFFVNDDNEVYRLEANTPVSMSRNMGGGWRRIDIKELKKNIDARNKAAAELRKEKGPQTTHEKIDDALDKFNKIADTKKSKAKKKTVAKKTMKKKTVAKKKTVSKKKTSRTKKSDKR